MNNLRDQLRTRRNLWNLSLRWGGTDKALSVQSEKRTFGCCVICGTALIGKRDGTVTCNSQCRSALRRERDKVERTLNRALALITDLEDMADQPDPVMSERACKALITLQDEISRARRETDL